MYPRKRALKKLSKSDKRRAASIREELEWLRKADNKWPFSVPEKGEKYRQAAIFALKIELQKIYDSQQRPPDLGISISEEVQTDEDISG